MPIADQRVEDGIRQPQARQMLARIGKWREDQSLAIYAGKLRVLRQIPDGGLVLTQ